MRKKCTKCEKLKELSAFHFNKQSKDGYRPDCKDCVNKRGKIYYLKNKEKIKQKTKKYSQNYRKKNKEKLQKQQKI